MLNVSNITYRVAGRTLLENTSLTIPDGHRVGLVGANGTGKSTLFNLISGELSLDAGEISVNSDAKVGMVKQEIDDENAKLIDIVLVADTERAELMESLETAEDPNLLAEIYERLANIHAYEAPARASTILSGLGFSDDDQQLPIKDFSGGWRMRVALAAALFREPDLLMLDEPTNHLDFEAMIWLENYLMNYKNTLLIISHDRDILNKTVDHIVHLDNLSLNSYTGNYDQFEQRRAEKLMNQQSLHEKQMAQKNKMMAFVDRFGAKASKAKQAQSRLKAIEKMDIVDAVIASRVTAFNFPSPEDLPPPIITLNNVDVGYEPSKPILSGLELRIDMEDRIALLGANGNGKSTLIKLLSGRLPQLTGHMERPDKLRVGYFAQHQSEELDMNATPYELLRDVMRSHGEAKTRALLGKFGFNKAKSDTKIDSLSGGEKARLLFCMMSYDAPHIMLLDEPTNHLDIDAREALIQALNNYNGCVIIVSHDPHLVACVADRLWLVADGTCKSYEGDLDEYRELIIQQRRKERSTGGSKKKSGLSKKEQRKLAAERRKQLAPLRQEITKAENQVEKLAQEKESLEMQIAGADASNLSERAGLQATYGKITKTLATKEEEWETLQSEYDQKMAG